MVIFQLLQLPDESYMHWSENINCEPGYVTLFLHTWGICTVSRKSKAVYVRLQNSCI